MPYNKEQRNAYQSKYRKQRRDTAIALLGGKCVVCSTNEDLQLNHIDPRSKSFNPGRFWGKAELYWQEVAKCNLLCGLHHREETARQYAKKLIGTNGALA